LPCLHLIHLNVELSQHFVLLSLPCFDILHGSAQILSPLRNRLGRVSRTRVVSVSFYLSVVRMLLLREHGRWVRVL
jgi:hypothetical protein